MKEKILEVRNLTKKYELGIMNSESLFMKNEIITALDDISFSIYKNDRVALLGRNGAGKSTLLKIICRITYPDSGYIGYNGRITSLLDVGVGFNDELTGRENIYLNGAILGLTRKQIAKQFDYIVKFAEIERFIDTPIKRYSSGMYTRLAFAVAAYLSADIVIMDEALAVGDIAFQKKSIDKMLELTEHNDRTIISVSHDFELISRLCNKAIVLDKGKIVFDGDIDDGIKRYSEILEIDR